MHIGARLLLLVSMVCVVGPRDVCAQPTDRPPLLLPSDRSSSTSQAQGSQAPTLATENLIVHHNEPAILHDASVVAGASAITKLSRSPRDSHAQSLHTRTRSVRAKIAREHRDFLLKSQQDLKLRGFLASARVQHLSNSINASIIQGAPRGTRERLVALGYKVESALSVHSLLSASVPAIGATQVWAELKDAQGLPITGKGVRVGVIDTGIDYTHIDFGSYSRRDFLAGACQKVQGGYDWVNNDNDPLDENLHGTHVASIIGANSSVKGVAPDVSMYALRVLDASGSGSSADIIRAIEWATDPNGDGDFSDHLDVINLSLGSSMGTPDSADSVAADNAAAAGVIVVAAAGNAGPEPGSIGSPGAARRAITVGASNLDGTLADFSSRGPVRSGDALIIKPDLVAPGVAICAGLSAGANRPRCADQYHTQLSGTSMAAPHIAGVAALIKQANPSIGPSDVKNLLKGTAKRLMDPQGLPLSVYDQGAGVVAALPAVRYALSGKSPAIATLNTNGTVSDDLLNIEGTADGSDFESFELFIVSPTSGSEELLQKGVSPVRDAELAKLDAAGLASGDYILKLVVHADGQRVETQSIITVSHLAIMSPARSLSAAPGTGVVHGSSNTIEVIGRVNGRGLVSYSLSLCWNFADQEGCAGDAITLNPDPSEPILLGPLASIDISKLSLQRRGVYSLRLKADYEQRASETIVHDFYLDPLILRDYNPKLLCDNDKPCSNIGQQPLLADINADGTLETVYTLSRHLHVVDKNGASLPGWPRSTDHSLLTPPSVGDLTGDGIPEIVVQGYDYLSGTRVRGAMYAFGADGSPVTGWPVRFDVDPSTMRRYLGDFITLADINSDRASEVLLSPFECLTADGSPCPDWTPPSLTVVPEGFRMFGGLAVGDLDSDGDLEIVSTMTNWQRWMQTGEERSIILVQDASGAILNSREVNSLIPAGPIITDVDGDGVNEFATYDRSNVTGKVSIVVRDITASPLPGWTSQIPNSILGDVAFSASFIAADLNGDGSSEIALQSDIDTRVIFYGNATASVRRPDDYRLSGFGSLVAANIDTDSATELLFVSRFYPFPLGPRLLAPDPREGLMALVALNDALVLERGFPILAPESSGYLYQIAVGDIDSDGENEIAYPTFGELIAFRTGGCANPREQWPFERASADRHASTNRGDSCSSGSGIFESCAQHSDNDLIDDCQDRCPLTDRLIPHPVCGCALDIDDPDGDGTPSCVDQCPLDPLKKNPGICGCFSPELDSDSDGIVDCDTLVSTLARPTRKPRILRRRSQYLKVSVPRSTDASSPTRKVAVCLKKRGGGLRCRGTSTGTVIFKPSSGYYSVYYTWLYSNGSVFRSPTVRTRITPARS